MFPYCRRGTSIAEKPQVLFFISPWEEFLSDCVWTQISPGAIMMDDGTMAHHCLGAEPPSQGHDPLPGEAKAIKEAGKLDNNVDNDHNNDTNFHQTSGSCHHAVLFDPTRPPIFFLSSFVLVARSRYCSFWDPAGTMNFMPCPKHHTIILPKKRSDSLFHYFWWRFLIFEWVMRQPPYSELPATHTFPFCGLRGATFLNHTEKKRYQRVAVNHIDHTLQSKLEI